MRHTVTGNPAKVLFTTACEDEAYDYIESNATDTGAPRLSYEREISYGLRFLEANVPGVHILEYPTWDEYLKVLGLGWDTIGFSFYTNEIPTVRRMAAAAREAGARELWGGNYGILNPETEGLFDRVAVGYAEREVCGWLGLDCGPLVHPTLIVPLKLGDSLSMIPLGVLFTLRGCNRACTFCQTPAFCGHRISPLPIESVAEVISEYRRLKVGAVLILDECFGSIDDHAEKVVSLLDDAMLPWLPMTRADILTKKISDWGSRGLAGALLGIESFRDTHLKTIRKGAATGVTRNLIERLRKQDRIVIGFYMIGLEDDTPATVETDLEDLESLDLDVTQVCILTPFPRTPLWDRLSEYGIDSKDLSKFDGKHLVWKHPFFTAADLEARLQHIFARTSSGSRATDTARRFGRQLMRRVGVAAGLSYLAGSFFYVNAVGPWARKGG